LGKTLLEDKNVFQDLDLEIQNIAISPQPLTGEAGRAEHSKIISTDRTPPEEVDYSSFVENTRPRKKKKTTSIYIT